jgi:hypothetical protein
MAAQITVEIMVGLTEKIRDGIEAACEYSGMKPSQYARQAIFRQLVADGYLQKPSFRKFDNAVPQISEPAE